MITIERHPNLDNWLEVRYFGKLLDQFTCSIKALAFAKQQATNKKTQVLNLDNGTKNDWAFYFIFNLFTYFCIYNKMTTVFIFGLILAFII